MDSPCIKQTVCKVLNIFQHGKYLVAYVLNFLLAKFQLNVFIVFSPILIGPLAKLNVFYISIKAHAYEYLISALILELTILTNCT